MIRRESGLGSVTILSVARDVADVRVQRLSQALVDAGASVTVHGLESTAEGPQGTVVIARPRRGMVRRLMRAATLPFLVKADVLVVVDPDLFMPAVVAGRLRRIRVVCDVYEDYVRVAADRAWARNPVLNLGARGFARASSWAAARSDVTLVADDHVPPAAARERVVVRNMPRADPQRELPARSAMRAAYVGDVRRSRGAVRMVEAVLAAPPWELDVVGPILDGEREEILAATQGSDRIRFHGRQTSEESWALIVDAAVGFSLLDRTPAFVDAMPTKIYEYASAGMAVIASDLPRQAAAVTEAQMGLVASDAATISDRLRRWQHDPALLESCRQNASEWAAINLDSDWPFGRAATAILALLDNRNVS